MSLGKAVDDFSQDVLSTYQKLKEQQRIEIEAEFVKFLGAEDAALIKNWEFDDEEEKFYNMEAPAHILEKFKAVGQLKDC